MAHPDSTSPPERFKALQQCPGGKFMPFTLLGWPTPEVSLTLIDALVAGGAHMLELGLAFSDPIADGPIIEAAASETVAKDMGFDVLWALLQKVRTRHPHIPICLMVYYNTLLSQGIDPFMAQAHHVGVDGVLVVDLPPELAAETVASAKAHHIAPVFIVSPLTPQERLSTILEACEGYVYVVSRLGITGVNAHYDDTLAQCLQDLRQKTDLPLMVGFGVSSPEDARHMRGLGADGVITGSRIIQWVQALLHEEEDALEQDAATLEEKIHSTLTPYVHGMVDALQWTPDQF